MLEIAAGILIALLILAALRYILVAAYWATAIAIGLAIIIASWFALDEGWAWAISIAAFFIWLGWYDSQDAPKKGSEKPTGRHPKTFGRKGL
jgi:membrane protein implicated in regulation of membrane protease activity